MRSLAPRFSMCGCGNAPTLQRRLAFIMAYIQAAAPRACADEVPRELDRELLDHGRLSAREMAIQGGAIVIVTTLQEGSDGVRRAQDLIVWLWACHSWRQSLGVR